MGVYRLTSFLILTGFMLVDSVPFANDTSVKEASQKAPARERTRYGYNKDTTASSKKIDYQQSIVALSKIAKVRLNQENDDPKENSERSPLLAMQLPLQLYNYHYNIVSNVSNGLKQEKFHCQAIRDVYIPDIQENVPSYKCTFGKKMFVLASKRFLEDRRNNLYINIDSNTLRKLNKPKPAKLFKSNNRFNFVPAILTLKPRDENYNIRN